MMSDEKILSRIAGLRKLVISAFMKSDLHLDLALVDRLSSRIILRFIFLLIIESRNHFPDLSLKLCIENKDEQLFSLLITDNLEQTMLFSFMSSSKQHEEKTDSEKPLVSSRDFYRVLKKLYKKIDENIGLEIISQSSETLLGSIYENSLLKQAQLSDKGRVSLKVNKSSKKTAGIFYTPQYVVNYILQSTIGNTLEELTPDEVAELKLLDPACGSGSFLLGAIKILLNWHLWYYTTYPDSGFNKRLQEKDGQWSLSPKESARVVFNNIYGLDLDIQAVEVSKLSILLTIFRHDNSCDNSNVADYFINLENNIKCGNALIEHEKGQQLDILFADNDRFGSTFNWDSEFLDIFSDPNPGFDFIVGNPPYRRELDFKKEMDEIAQSTLGQKYRIARMDYWYYFVHRGIELLKIGGQLSFITNSYWISGKSAKKLISHIMEECAILELFMLGKSKVFQSVMGQHMIFRIEKTSGDRDALIKMVPETFQGSAEEIFYAKQRISSFVKKQSSLYHRDSIVIFEDSSGIVNKIGKNPPLENFGKIRQGIAENPASINARSNKKYNNKWQVGEGVFTLTESELKELDLTGKETTLIRPYHDLSDIARYYIAVEPSLNLIYSTGKTCPNIDVYPNLKKHLSRFRAIMEDRRETVKGSNKWWHLHWPREESIWKSHKIIALQMALRPSFVAAKAPVYSSFSTNVFVPDENCRMNYYYLSGILNSKLLWLWFKNHAKRRGIGLEISGSVLAKAPVYAIDFSSNQDISQHNRIVRLVDRMIALKKEIRTLKNDADKYPLQKQINEIDEEIDVIVMELYGISENEREEILKKLDLPA